MLSRTKLKVVTFLVLTVSQCLTIAVRGAAAAAHHPPEEKAPAHPTPSEAKTKAPVKAESTENDLSNIGKSTSENLRFQEATEYEQQQNIQAAKKVNRAMQLRGSTEQLEAAKLLKEVITSDASRAIKGDVVRAALMSLAEMAERNGQLAQAQQVWSEYIERYPDDVNVPEIFLRQAYLYQRMGAYETAISKLYLVGKAAMNPKMKISNLAYLKRVTLTMESEIADTYFMWERYEDATKQYDALLKKGDPELNVEVVNAKLIRALSRAASADSSKYDAVIRRGIEFLKDHGESDYQVEVRYLVASAYKALDKKDEALNQLMQLLLMMDTADEKKAAKWKNWKMQAGNEIGNQLFLSGDTTSALQVYEGLLHLDDSPDWKLPIHYQIGLCYERNQQPTRAVDAYIEILKYGELISSDAVVDVVKLITKLSSAGTNAVSSYVWNQIAPAIRTQLQDSEVGRDRKKPALLEALNGVLQKPSLYDTARFSGVTLSPETAELLKAKNPTAADLVRLNRKLLEDTYAVEIVKKQKTSAKLEPSLQLVVDMARFRKDILSWKLELETSQRPPVEPKVTQK